MQRTLKRELKSTWNCWKGSEGNQYHVLSYFPWACLWALWWCMSQEWLPKHKCLLCLCKLLLVKWFSFPRLETRTKESNMCASFEVKNFIAQWKWQWLDLYGHNPPASILRENGLSVSMNVGTRKMVNYAWIGWSQGKLWWRLVAILTCKSIVKFGYRGERLIEPSSSWFPPKFPSG